MKYLLLIPGGVLVFIAIFANQLGLDNDAGWGGSRTLILKVGIVFILLGLALVVFKSHIRKFHSWFSTITEKVGHERSINMAFIAAAILTAAAYIWFIRDATDAARFYNYYGELAKGFRQGNLYLPEKPSAELLALSNPYDTTYRKQIGLEDFPWDLTLYKGNFYIYWGPTPAFFLIPFNEEILTRIEDLYIALFFAYGLFLYSALIVVSVWKRQKHAPIWMLFVSLLVIGFSIPITTMLKKGEVYEAAIFASQFFFIGGCFWVYSSYQDEAPQTWKFVLAGIHWMFALGARATILPVVAVTALCMIFPILTGVWMDWKNRSLTNLGQRLKPVIAVGLPLLVGGITLAWYNYARFGDILEFGVSYQLANLDYTQFKDKLFGLQYINPNLRTYLLYPVEIARRYPFISLVEYTPTNDRLSGLLYIAPFIALVFLPLLRLIIPSKIDRKPLFLFTGAMTVQAFVILAFFFITLRYTLDFLPSALLLIILYFGMEYEIQKDNPITTGVLSIIFTIPAFANITAGVLLATPPDGVTFMLNFLNDVIKLLGLK